jgi:pimeloyl-ACP methyl ester carboxylesterase
MMAQQAHERYRDCYLEVPDGLQLHYRDYPGADDKPPLLCLHGLTRNARDFEHFAERYSPDFRVLVLEFRGRGLSDYDPQPSRYTPLTYCADVQHLLDHVGAPEAIFVGTSLGGLVTMSMAVLGPQRIAASILNDVGPELGQSGLDRIQSYVGKGERFSSWEEAASSIASNQASAFPNYGPEEWLAAARRYCREESGAVLFDYDVAIAAAFQNAGPTPKIDLWPLFRALAAKPLLIIRGALSELLSASTAQKMREAAPNADFVEVPDVGHAPMLDEPEALAAIDAFLRTFKA